jgi:hypothetical protein
MYYAVNVQTRVSLAAAALLLAGCSAPPPDTKPTKSSGAPQTATSVISSQHPLAKYLELGGFRLSEMGSGKIRVRFAVINHSDADIGDLALKVKLTTTAAKPEDPPITQFEVKIPALGPQEIKDVSATAATKLRIYEMPDWQFIRAEAEITSPAP